MQRKDKKLSNPYIKTEDYIANLFCRYGLSQAVDITKTEENKDNKIKYIIHVADIGSQFMNYIHKNIHNYR